MDTNTTEVTKCLKRNDVNVFDQQLNIFNNERHNYYQHSRAAAACQFQATTEENVFLFIPAYAARVPWNLEPGEE